MDRMACVDLRSTGACADGAAPVAARLRQFSPEVEPSRDQPGVFWLNASGLAHLYRSPRDWAKQVVAALRVEGHPEAAIAVGFTRFGTYAIARRLASIDRQIVVIRDRAAERAIAGKAPLDRLGLDAALIDSLEKLGVRTVRAFLELPAVGVRRRFGREAHRLHRRASGDLDPPLQPVRPPEPLLARHDFDQPETDVNRLLFIVKRLLDRLLAATAERRERLAELTLHLRLDARPDGRVGSSAGAKLLRSELLARPDGRVGSSAGAKLLRNELLASEERAEVIRPAAPTLDIAQLMTLVRLRFESVAFEGGVVGLRVAGRSVRTVATQEGLFAERPPRDLSAANHALARVRARFGDGAVARARLAEGHLPEARFAWEPVDTIPPPAGVTVRPGGMVRRIYATPRPVPASHAAERAGPYRVAGGWWRVPVSRDYYFARLRNGDLLWIYYDRARRRWCCQGRVE